MDEGGGSVEKLEKEGGMEQMDEGEGERERDAKRVCVCVDR